MNQQQILIYLKRHAISITALLAALGVVGYGYTWMGGKKNAIADAETQFNTAMEKRKNIERGQKMGGAAGSILVDEKNVDKANEEVAIYEGFIQQAQKVIRTDSVAEMDSAEFIIHMTSVLEELNQRAREARVQVPKDPTNSTPKIPYNFTFAHLRSDSEIARNKIPSLQLQLKDIRTIAEILNRSGVQSIQTFKRNRVTNEDFLAGNSPDYLNPPRDIYTGTFSAGDAEIKMEVRPYKVRFQCLSGAIAKALTAFAAEKSTFYVVRKMEVTQLGTKTPAASGSPYGAPGMPGGAEGMAPPGMGLSSAAGAGGIPPGGGISGLEGAPPGGAAAFPGGASTAPKPNKKGLNAWQMGQLIRGGLATPKAVNVISEFILEVELDLDVVRKQIEEPDPSLDPGVDPAAANPNPPVPATNAPAPVPVPPATNAPVPVPPATNSPTPPGK